MNELSEMLSLYNKINPQNLNGLDINCFIYIDSTCLHIAAAKLFSKEADLLVRTVTLLLTIVHFILVSAVGGGGGVFHGK